MKRNCSEKLSTILIFASLAAQARQKGSF